jgi:hypothetical protein
MTNLDHLKTLIIDAVQTSHDADLLDLIFKLLIAEG